MTTPDSPPLAPRQSDPSKPRGGRRVRLAVGITLAMAIAIAGWAIFLLPKGGTPGAPRTTSSPPTGTSPTPTPSSDPQASDDVAVAFRAIYAKRTRATVEARPDIVDEIYRPSCECSELKSMIEGGVRRGAHYVGYNPSIVLVYELTEGFARGPNLATVRAVTQQGPYTVTDSSGQPIASEAGWEPQSSAWTLVRTSPDGPWKVEHLLVEGPAEKVLGPQWKDRGK